MMAHKSESRFHHSYIWILLAVFVVGLPVWHKGRNGRKELGKEIEWQEEGTHARANRHTCNSSHQDTNVRI